MDEKILSLAALTAARSGGGGGSGMPGRDGKDGADGLTPYIGDNGNWWIGDEDTGVSASGGGGSSSGGGKETVYEFTTTEVCAEIKEKLSLEVSKKIWNASIISIYVDMRKDTTDTTITTSGTLGIKLSGINFSQSEVIPAPATSWINFCQLELIVLNMQKAGLECGVPATPAFCTYKKQNSTSAGTPTMVQVTMWDRSTTGYDLEITGSQNFGIGTKVKIAIA